MSGSAKFCVPAVGLCLALAACGGSSTNPTNAGGNNGAGGGSSCTSVGPLGSAKGTITGTISGSTFNGGVPTGLSVYTPIAAVPSLGLPSQDFFTISGTCGDLTSLQITARATLGTTVIGLGTTDTVTKQPLTHSVLLQLRSNGAAAGTWITSQLGGSGTITVTAVSTSAATGSFSLTMTPQAAPATGNQTVTGQFNVTF